MGPAAAGTPEAFPAEAGSPVRAGDVQNRAAGGSGGKPEEKRWYTVKEAAEYLGVSQPTIFRWMKDNILSFYKVGGSTRFTREGLDSVVEKTTGIKEAEAAQNTCARCGHTGLVDGRIQGMGKLYFKPDRTKFWTLQESLVPTRARACLACGQIQWQADDEKLRRLNPEEETPEEENG